MHCISFSLKFLCFEYWRSHIHFLVFLLISGMYSVHALECKFPSFTSFPPAELFLLLCFSPGAPCSLRSSVMASCSLLADARSSVISLDWEGFVFLVIPLYDLEQS